MKDSEHIYQRKQNIFWGQQKHFISYRVSEGPGMECLIPPEMQASPWRAGEGSRAPELALYSPSFCHLPGSGTEGLKGTPGPENKIPAPQFFPGYRGGMTPGQRNQPCSLLRQLSREMYVMMFVDVCLRMSWENCKSGKDT